ncbi:MAG: hypothetical protein V7K90_24340 [Nostoc sp.]|uniref:hypothetical protein n=1 Tax=Nostoc sp. TaxID=1180 RepID=UPI002FF71D04
MNKQFLTQFPLAYADSIRFENSGYTFQITMSNSECKLLVILKNILTFNFSKDSLTSDEDWIDIIGITHEYRKPTQQDLRKYSFFSGNINELPALHIVTFDGNTVIEVICEEVEVKELG